MHNAPTVPSTCIGYEFARAKLGDARLSARLLALAEALAAAPSLSLPQALRRSKAQLEAAYRFFGNDAVTMPAILEPHQAQTHERMTQHQVVLVVHDTTTLEYSGEREGIGPLGGAKHRGFLLHAALAVTADGTRQPLGVLAARTWARSEAKRPKVKGRSMNGPQYARIDDKESQRWARQIEQVHLDDGGTQLVHVADREGDAYPLLQWLHETGKHYIIRAARDRRIEDDDDDLLRLSDACARATQMVELDVPISARKAKSAPRAARTHPGRDRRTAKLCVSAFSVDLKRPAFLGPGAILPVNVAYVRELDAPADAAPIEWVLYTSLPIDTPGEVLAIVEHYRARWMIEELFKALKTGCQIEKLQLESYAALTNALAVYLPIAWSILALRSMERSNPTAPATAVMSQTQLAVLRHFSSYKLGPQPSVRDGLLAVAALGGYIPHRKPPGWLVLARGMHDLLRYELVWNAAKTACDVRDP